MSSRLRSPITRAWRFGLGLLIGALAVEATMRAVEAVAGAERLEPSELEVHARQLGASPHDLVVLGSSSAGAAIWPTELEQAGLACAAYTAWLGSPSMDDVARYADELLDSSTAPDQVVIGVTMREFNAHPTQPVNERVDRFLGSGEGVSGALERWLATFRMRPVIQDPIRFGRNLVQGADSIATEDGHHALSLDHVIAEESAAHRRQEVEEMADYALDPDAVRALDELISSLRGRDIHVAVVNLPVTDEFIDLAPAGRRDYDRYLDAVREVVDRAGVAWFDGEDVELPTATLFADVNHLNRNGAERLTAALGSSGALRPAGPCAPSTSPTTESAVAGDTGTPSSSPH